MRDGFPPDRSDPRVRVMCRDPFPDPFASPLPASFRLPATWGGDQPRAAECPAFERRSARWQETSFIARPPRLGVFRRNSCVEVARFVVAQGCTGIIHRIALSLEARAGSMPFIGLDPFFLQKTAPTPGKGIRFHLRLEPYNQAEERNLGFTVSDVAHLPGMPHPELGTWDDSRYWFGFAATRCRIRVPERSRASLWIEMATSDVLLRELTGLYGLLQGHVWQYQGNPSAYRNSQDGLG